MGGGGQDQRTAAGLGDRSVVCGVKVLAAARDPPSHQLVNQGILVLERNGPGEGRPLVDTITASRIAKHEGTAEAIGWAD